MTSTSTKAGGKPSSGKKIVKKAIKKKATKKRVSGPAGKINKSQAIRDYHDKNPEDGPTAVTRALAEKGIQVSPPQVSNVLSAAGKGGKKRIKRKKRGPKPGSSRAVRTTDQVSLDSLINAQKFADQVGGVESAKQLIGALERLSK